MIALGTTFIVVLLALQVHEVELVNQAVALEQIESAVDGHTIDLGIDPAGMAQDLAGVEVLLGGLHHTQDGATLARHAHSTRHQFGLQAAWGFGLRQRHGVSLSCKPVAIMAYSVGWWREGLVDLSG
jgi:hypothetical protein